MIVQSLTLLSLWIAVLLPSSLSPSSTSAPSGRKARWQALFDGKTTQGWHNFKKNGPPDARWTVEDGCLMLTSKGGGDILTDQAFADFELELEWKISEKGNSGIFFRVSEDSLYDAVYRTGPEMQVLDDDGHPDGKIPSHRAGCNYDLALSLAPDAVKKPGEWNRVRIEVKQNRVQYFLNGKKTADYVLLSPEWEALVQKSKFRTMPGYGRMSKGKIALQDHGDKVWYRNIRIREL